MMRRCVSGCWLAAVVVFCLFQRIHGQGATSCSAGNGTCPSGWGIQPDSEPANCTECTPGRYQTTDTSNTTVKFNTFWRMVCQDCPPGRYSSTTAATSCIFCTPGKYSANASAVSCITCPLGTFQYRTGQTSCQACQPGRNRNVNDPTSIGSTAITCGKCAIGKFSNMTADKMIVVLNATTNTSFDVGPIDCTDCPAGRFNPHLQQSVCEECDVATFQNQSGQSFCYTCPPGRFQDVTGSLDCVDCDPGSWSEGGHPWCWQCDPGRYSNIARAGICPQCPDSQYNNESGMSFCYDCPSGLTSDANFGTNCSTAVCTPAPTPAPTPPRCGVGTPSPTPNTASAVGFLRIQGPYSAELLFIGSPARASFVAAITADVIAVLNINASQFLIQGLFSGSVIVQFALFGALADSGALNNATGTELLEQLQVLVSNTSSELYSSARTVTVFADSQYSVVPVVPTSAPTPEPVAATPLVEQAVFIGPLAAGFVFLTFWSIIFYMLHQRNQLWCCKKKKKKRKKGKSSEKEKRKEKEKEKEKELMEEEFTDEMAVAYLSARMERLRPTEESSSDSSQDDEEARAARRQRRSSRQMSKSEMELAMMAAASVSGKRRKHVRSKTGASRADGTPMHKRIASRKERRKSRADGGITKEELDELRARAGFAARGDGATDDHTSRSADASGAGSDGESESN